MKIQIRKNVFETNSSSTHSICITQSDSILKFPDCVYFNTGNFGWEYKRLDSVNEKASIFKEFNKTSLNFKKTSIKNKFIEVFYLEEYFV